MSFYAYGLCMESLLPCFVPIYIPCYSWLHLQQRLAQQFVHDMQTKLDNTHKRWAYKINDFDIIETSRDQKSIEKRMTALTILPRTWCRTYTYTYFVRVIPTQSHCGKTHERTGWIWCHSSNVIVRRRVWKIRPTLCVVLPPHKCPKAYYVVVVFIDHEMTTTEKFV